MADASADAILPQGSVTPLAARGTEPCGCPPHPGQDRQEVRASVSLSGRWVSSPGCCYDPRARGWARDPASPRGTLAEHVEVWGGKPQPCFGDREGSGASCSSCGSWFMGRLGAGQEFFN